RLTRQSSKSPYVMKDAVKVEGMPSFRVTEIQLPHYNIEIVQTCRICIVCGRMKSAVKQKCPAIRRHAHMPGGVNASDIAKAVRWHLAHRSVKYEPARQRVCVIYDRTPNDHARIVDAISVASASCESA